MPYDSSTLARFWSQVDCSGGPDACWPWQAKTFRGYGIFDKQRAHRFAFAVKYGQVPSGLDVLHRCDTPLCCNPAHLWAGTHQENMDDMVAKGRSLRGERGPAAVLTDEQVREIRASYTGKYGEKRKLARRYGVCTRTIWRVLSGRGWAI